MADAEAQADVTNLVRRHGMLVVLDCLIEHVRRGNTRRESYLNRLMEDLAFARSHYAQRYGEVNGGEGDE